MALQLYTRSHRTHAGNRQIRFIRIQYMVILVIPVISLPTSRDHESCRYRDSACYVYDGGKCADDVVYEHDRPARAGVRQAHGKWEAGLGENAEDMRYGYFVLIISGVWALAS